MDSLNRQHPMTCCAAVMTGVQYQGTPEDYDGISEWRCEVCGARQWRWSRRQLAPKEIETRHNRVPDPPSGETGGPK